MQRLRITTADDAAAFELLCSSWAEAQKLREVLRREGVTYETLKSQGTRMVRARPELTALGDIDRRVLNLLARFGLTPADRSRVSDLALPDPTSNPDDEFIS